MVNFQSFSSDGALQLDAANSFALTFIKKGVAYPSMQWYYGSSVYVDIVVTDATYPLLAIYCLYPTSITNVTKSGSTWTFRVVAIATNGQATIEWYHFDKPLAFSNNVGLELYRGDGQTVWSSSQAILPLVGVGAMEGLPSGGKYAYVGGSRIYTNEDVVVDTKGELYVYWSFQLTTFQCHSAGVSSSLNQLASGGQRGDRAPQPFIGEDGPGIDSNTILVLDVRNL